MVNVQRLFVIVLLAAMGFVVASRGAARATDFGSTKLVWNITPYITLTVTPNYQTGFGPQGGTGSGSTPAPGPGAVPNGGVIDFGSNVVQGYQYIYKYAAQASVVTNDGNGFNLYGEGTSDINDTTLGGTIPINQTLYWLISNAANGPFTGATAFQATTSPTSAGCGGQCINYAGSPPASALVYHYPNSTLGQPGNTVAIGYDYQLHLGGVANADSFSVYVTYTAVGN